ncbi:MAG: DUF2326 domain-containing protein [Desulforudis sp.]|jgi:uncharacterized protein YydD (DUF2326 family)|nr:MAG: DUF2326 domain-containing protein [Desulforudis sp.]
MIYNIYSTLPTFKTLEVKAGLNVLIAEKEQGASIYQTRNRAGKTSLIEIIHFLMGADAGMGSLFRMDALVDSIFGIEFDLGGNRIKAERSGIEKSKVHVFNNNLFGGNGKVSIPEWHEILGDAMFNLSSLQDFPRRSPTFRSLFAYFVRRQQSGAFIKPEEQSRSQQVGDYQMALMYLLGLDWEIASDWILVRDDEKNLRELKKAAGSGTLGNIIGKVADLRTKLAVSEDQLNKLKSQLDQFQVFPKYSDLETEADEITFKLNSLANDQTIDAARIRDLEKALGEETPPVLTDLESLYAEAGVLLPGVVLETYEDVLNFHRSIIRNRKDYLEDELNSARQRMIKRDQLSKDLDDRRSVIMEILQSHGALEQFFKLQAEVGRQEAEVATLRNRFRSAEKLESSRDEFKIRRNQLTQRLRRDFLEQDKRVTEAILAFEETSKRLYESAGSMTIEITSNGPSFHFPIQGSRSKGIQQMQIFCFDLMLMRICANRGIGPGFLIHDSHLFDSVDGRQFISAMKVGAETANELGFQYIVTMNEDDAFKEKIDGFDLHDYVLPVTLTDATENGGLFGFRF